MNRVDTKEFVLELQRRGVENPARIIRIIGELFHAFNEAADGHRAAVYCKHLADVRSDVLERGIGELIRTRTFMPKIGEIRTHIAKRTLDAAAGHVPNAARAWSEVMTKLGSCGTRRSIAKDTEWGERVTFDDPITTAIITPAWWRRLGMCKVADLGFEQQRFTGAYDAHVQRAVTDRAANDMRKALSAAPSKPELNEASPIARDLAKHFERRTA